MTRTTSMAGATMLVLATALASGVVGGTPATAAATGGASTTSTGAASSTPSPASRFEATTRWAATYAARHEMQSGVAVLDTVTGRIYSAGRDRHLFPGASVVKTMIATALLLTDQMHGATAKLARSMITRSDNPAAARLYAKVGRDRLLPRLARHYRLDHIGTAPTMPGVWGSTRLKARGLVRFYAAVRADHRVWPWLSSAMHAYRQVSSGGEPNAFGIARVAPRSAVKNGWATNRDIRHPRNAIINSTGFVRSDRYAVAILSEGPGALYYRAGEQIVTEQAQRLLSSAQVRHALTKWRATIVLDPGHNGANSTHPATINRQVYAGYGRYKACNTTGTATNSGYPEHVFTWAVAKRVREILLGHHIRVIMTRADDTGVGPCVNKRAAIESTSGVAAAIAIHADGASAGSHGFHLCVDGRRPEHASRTTVARTQKLNAALHRSLVRNSRISVANYVGRNGYYYRDDLAGLNLSTNPTAFLELGNMRNAHDAGRQRSMHGRARIASAVAIGILAYLSG